jgi:putative membrane protein
MYWPHMDGFWWGGGIIGILTMLLFLGLFIALAYFLFRAGATNQRFDEQNRQRPDALQILKQRYARGEISRAEYKEMRRELLA